MAPQLKDFGPPKIVQSFTTDELRSNLSQVINRAAFGVDPVLVTRGGRKIAAVISLVDLVFLENMKHQRKKILSKEVPDTIRGAGLAMGERLKWELFFGRYP
jgi:prevent-host-death family protein